MKTFCFGLMCFLLAGLAVAQGPTVTVTVSGTTITASDHDDTCVFHAPSVTDNAIVECYDGANTSGNVKLHATVNLQINDPIGGSFVADNHTITWTLERVSTSLFTYDITVDGKDFKGTF